MTEDTVTIPDVRLATPFDVDALSRTLASAFREDPVFSWGIPDARERGRLLPGWFRVVVAALVEHQETYRTEDGSGAALWVPPGVAPLTEEQEERLGEATAAFGDTALARFAALSGEMDARHPHEPHLYLWFAGVHADHQGRGYGGRLLRSRLGRADEQGLPAYLEATSERNRALYQRHGFEVTGKLSVDGSPPLWQMWRDPRSS